MKNLLKVTIAVIFLMGATSLHAQKFGRINMQELITVMPETEKMRTDLETFAGELEGMLESISVEWQNKFQEYQKGMETMSKAILEHKEEELRQLQTRRDEFSQTAQTDYQEMQAKLFEPIHVKAKAAVTAVSKAGGYIVVFDTSLNSNTMAYLDEANITDILPLVKKNLGIANTPAVAAN